MEMEMEMGWNGDGMEWNEMEISISITGVVMYPPYCIKKFLSNFAFFFLLFDHENSCRYASFVKIQKINYSN